MIRFFSLICLLIFFSGYELFAQSVQPLHIESRMGGIDHFSLNDEVLSLEFSRLEEAFLVLKSENPLRLLSAHDVEATLTPGWDGSLGYLMYGLRLVPEKEGRAAVSFEVTRPPAGAIPTTVDELKQFKEQLHTRNSRFPDNVSDFQGWQEQYRDSLIHALMGGSFPDRVDGDVEIEYELAYENFS